jgi:Surface-adhesin protein E
MKWVLLVSLTLGLIFAMSQGVLAGDWRVYTSSEFGFYHYDAADVQYLWNGNIRVREKLLLTGAATMKLAEGLGRGYESVKEISVLREMDCTGRKSQILGVSYFSENGMVSKGESYDEPVEWDSIDPDSVDDILYHVVCKGSTVTYPIL